MNIPKI